MDKSKTARFGFTHSGMGCFEDGQYVRFDDYVELEAKAERLDAQLASLRRKVLRELYQTTTEGDEYLDVCRRVELVVKSSLGGG